MRIGFFDSLTRDQGTHWRALLSCLGLVAMIISAPPAQAYGTYSEEELSWQDEKVGNCKTCHGNFAAADYRTPFKILQRSWEEGPYYNSHYGEWRMATSLHDVHRHIMLGGLGNSCFGCHLKDDQGDRINRPVRINESAGYEDGRYSTGCMGCHGRDGDGTKDGRMGAGLQQYHTNAGVTECLACHSDADPANYTPLGEDVQPPNYIDLGIDPCNRRDEDFAGSFLGLDNDGDGKTDWFDRDCRRR